MASKKVKIEIPRGIPRVQTQSGPWKSLEELYKPGPIIRNPSSLRTSPKKIKKIRLLPADKKEVKISRSHPAPKGLNTADIDGPFEGFEELSESDIISIEPSSGFNSSRVAIPIAKTEIPFSNQDSRPPDWDDIPLLDSGLLIELSDDEPANRRKLLSKSEIESLLTDITNLCDVLIKKLGGFLDNLLDSIVVKKGK